MKSNQGAVIQKAKEGTAASGERVKAAVTVPTAQARKKKAAFIQTPEGSGCSRSSTTRTGLCSTDCSCRSTFGMASLEQGEQEILFTLLGSSAPTIGHAVNDLAFPELIPLLALWIPGVSDLVHAWTSGDLPVDNTRQTVLSRHLRSLSACGKAWDGGLTITTPTGEVDVLEDAHLQARLEGRNQSGADKQNYAGDLGPWQND